MVWPTTLLFVGGGLQIRCSTCSNVHFRYNFVILRQVSETHFCLVITEFLLFLPITKRSVEAEIP